MPLKDIVMISSQLTAGAVVTFLAIMLWSQTREVEWVLVIIGVLLKYVQILVSSFSTLGIIQSEIYIISKVVDLETLLKILPLIFYSLAFITRLVKIKRGVEY